MDGDRFASWIENRIKQLIDIFESNQLVIDHLDYDDKNVYWKGKSYARSKMKEGNPNLPWEKEAYSKTDPYDKY